MKDMPILHQTVHVKITQTLFKIVIRQSLIKKTLHDAVG